MDLLSVLTAPVAVVSTLLTAYLLGFAAQRLLGIRLGVVRILATGLFAATVLPAMAVTLTRFRPATEHPQPPGWVEVWFMLLAGMLTLLASMAFIVVVEAFAPLGSIPPATVWGRGLKGRWSRARRTGQVVWIALRHGLGPLPQAAHVRRPGSADVPGTARPGVARDARSVRDHLREDGAGPLDPGRSTPG